ncbi:MAG: glycoside hydrolase family 31 protein [Candidatus Cryptobacteroides sp.]|nr:glycoside hydrolase family 31 protein [Candidatus Cryptobacteroides sp.]
MNHIISNAGAAILATLFLSAACTADKVEISINKPVSGEASRIRIEAPAQTVIHVTASPDSRIPKKESLVVTGQGKRGRVKLKTIREDGYITVSTDSISVRVDSESGQMSFFDCQGKPLLENARSSFSRFNIEGEPLYSVVQTFDSPEDESFYGLGQHQSDDFNYKGKIEELYQFNTKISIPFIYSTKGYGLYFDNYSWSRFGHYEGERQLDELFILRDRNGSEGGLSGSYISADGHRVERTEPRLCWSDIYSAAEGLPKEISLNDSWACFDGSIEPLESGEYTFNLLYAGYVRLLADGKEVIPEIWRTTINPNVRRFTLKLEKGKKLPVRIDWMPDGNKSFLALTAYPPLSEELKSKQIWYSEAVPCQDYYFIKGDRASEVIRGYRQLTGKAPMMPKWVLGYWQSRDRYYTQEQILSNLTEFRTRNLPIDNIVMDWNHWPRSKWGCHEFEQSRFPDPKAMVDSIHSLNAHIMVSVWPKFYPESGHYDEFLQKGWLYERSIRDSLIDWLGYPYAFYDAYNPDARKLFWKQVEDHYIPLGVDAWWMDASEPNVLANTPMNYRKQLCGPTALGSSDEYFNAYALVNARGIFEGEAVTRKDHRPFLLTRSAFAGLQRYNTAAWSGDICARWEEMKAQISAGLNFSFCGIPWWTMDIGGYVPEKRYIAACKAYEKNATESEDLDEWRELYTRWFQFGAFTPIFRSHGQYPLREPWNIAPEGHPAYESIRYYLGLRYRLMPYLYSLAGASYLDDEVLMRALVMEFPDDRASRSISDEFMLGPSLLVAPVCQYKARSREVYLPECKGGWYNYYDGCPCASGTILADAPYERIPLFVRAGSIIAEGPDCQSSSEGTPEELTLKVYSGADGQMKLYEDRGEGKEYENGWYSIIPVSFCSSEGILKIGQRNGSFEGMPLERTLKVVVFPSGSERTVRYDGHEIEIKLSE